MKKISSLAFAFAALCFLMPFVNVSCQGHTVRSLTGTQLALGTEMVQPTGFGQPQSRKVPPDSFAAAALALSVAGIFVTFGPGKIFKMATVVTTAMGIICLLILKTNLDSEIVKSGGGALKLEYGGAFWMAIVMFGAAAAIRVLQPDNERTARGQLQSVITQVPKSESIHDQ
jgi:hypothetical protein